MVVALPLWALVVLTILFLLSTDRSNSPYWEHWIPAVFFLSGFPALIYQIVWQRALFVVFGSNIQSVTIIVTLFILGLGIGSLVSGWISAGINSPLLIFGILELSIGLLGIVSIPVFKFVSSHANSFSTAGTMLTAMALLLPPTMLMGATLPMLVSHLSIKDPVSVGRSVGRLYFVNTLGSAIACFVCAQFAMRALGEHRMTLAAACLNFLVAAYALKHGSSRAAHLNRPLPSSDGLAHVSAFRPRLPFGAALVLAALTGFIALAYEIIWYRLYSYADGGTASGFAYVLGAYLVGIAYGSLIAESRCRKAEENHSEVSFGLIGGLIVGFNILAFLVAPALGIATRTLGAEITLLLIAIAAGCLGSVFPLLANSAISPGEGAGEKLGVLYFVNMVGAALGSFLVGYMAFNVLPLQIIAGLLVSAGVLCGTVILAASCGSKSIAAGCAILALIFAVSTPRLFDHLYEKLLFKSQYKANLSFKHVVENRNGVITVSENGTVYGGGVFDGAFNTELVNDSNGIIRCFALSGFHPTPQKVLVIGLSSGSWAQVIANHPQVKEVEIVEINPGYLKIIPEYPQVASLLNNPKVSIHIDDGRRWLRRNPGKKFDLIVLNMTYFWRANATNLLSKEFLELVRTHLLSGGVFFYNTTSSAEAQLTGVTVFPYGLRVANFLAVSDSPIVIDRDRLRRTLLEYKIDSVPVIRASDESYQRRLQEIINMLEPVPYGEDKVYYSTEFADSIRMRFAGSRIMTDDNMGSEW